MDVSEVSCQLELGRWRTRRASDLIRLACAISFFAARFLSLCPDLRRKRARNGENRAS